MLKCSECGHKGLIITFIIEADDWDFYKCDSCKTRVPVRRTNAAPPNCPECENEMTFCEKYEADVAKCPKEDCGKTVLVEYTIRSIQFPQ